MKRRFWDNEDLVYGASCFLVGGGIAGMLTWVIWGDITQPHFFTWALPSFAAEILGLHMQGRAIRLRTTRGDRVMQTVEAAAAALRDPRAESLYDDPGYRAALLTDIERNAKANVVLDPRAEPFMPEGLRRLIADGWVRKLRTASGAMKFELTQAGRHALDSGQTGRNGERA